VADDRDPFHPGERALQDRLGVRNVMARIGPRAVRDYLIDQHRAFFEQIPVLFYAALDREGQPWASLVCGPPGFIRSPDSQHLCITTQPLAGDPVFSQLKPGDDVGLLGLIFHTRRRNRANGRVDICSNSGFDVSVYQSFGNCPKYIQARSPLSSVADLAIAASRSDSSVRVIPSDRLSDRARSIIQSADTFFIATHFSDGVDTARGGVDCSHRGGKAGFVRIDSDTVISWPDFAGNQFFNTLGNLSMNSASGLVFLDFDTGDVLYLAGHTEILWLDESATGFVGAERMLRFEIKQTILAEKSFPVQWTASELSPFLKTTGSWPE